jgi:hypothetical protein
MADIEDIKRRYKEAADAWNEVEDELLSYGLKKYQDRIDSATSVETLDVISKEIVSELPDSTTLLVLKNKMANKRKELAK